MRSAGALLLLSAVPILSGCPEAKQDPAVVTIPPLPREAGSVDPEVAAHQSSLSRPEPKPPEPDEESWDPSRPLAEQGEEVAPPPPPQPDEQEVDPETIQPVVEGAITKLPGIRIWRDEQRIEVEGFVCLKQGPALELMACTPRGKTHESLFLVDCHPVHLQLALILLGLEPTPQVDEFGQVKALERGAKVVVEVSWKAEDAPQGDASAPPAVDGRVRRWVEDVIYDRRRRGPMLRVGWVFTGSRQVKVPAPPDWKTEREVFAAGYTGNVVAIYHDPDAILDTPLVEGGDDTLFYPYAERLPERETAVVFHIRPWSPEDEEVYGANLKAPPPSPPAGEPGGEAPPDDGGR